MKNNVTVEPVAGLNVKRLDPRASLPTRAHPGDLGWDLYALENDTLYLGHVKTVRTGIAVYLSGYGFKIHDRSSMAMKGVVTSGGLIDVGYRGECFVNLTLISPPCMGTTRYEIKAGDRIAQLVPMRHWADHYPVEEVAALPEGDRGARGYGSTGN